MRVRQIKNFFSLVVVAFIFLTCLAVTHSAETADPNYLEDALQNEERSDFLAEEDSLKLPSVGGVAFRMFFFLLVVLGIMLVFFVIAQKFVGKHRPNQASYQDVIKILSYRRFDVRKSVYVLDVLGKVLVVGADIDGMNLIAEITDPEQIAKAKELDDVAPEIYRLNPFQGILNKFSGEYQPPQDTHHRRRDRETKGLINKIDDLKNKLAR